MYYSPPYLTVLCIVWWVSTNGVAARRLAQKLELNLGIGWFSGQMAILTLVGRLGGRFEGHCAKIDRALHRLVA
jgi:hypothetical protein